MVGFENGSRDGDIRCSEEAGGMLDDMMDGYDEGCWRGFGVREEWLA